MKRDNDDYTQTRCVSWTSSIGRRIRQSIISLRPSSFATTIFALMEKSFTCPSIWPCSCSGNARATQENTSLTSAPFWLNGNRQDVLWFVKKERHVERSGEKFVASTYVVVTQLDCQVNMVDIMVFQYDPDTLRIAVCRLHFHCFAIMLLFIGLNSIIITLYRT